MTNPNTTDDNLAARVRALLDHAITNLDPQDRDERIAYCREHDQHGIRMHLSDDDDLLEFRWGNRPLAMIHRDALLSDQPLRVEFIEDEIPDTPEGLTDD